MALQFFPRATPSKPRQPPATSTTTGQSNTIADAGYQGNMQLGVPYGAFHRKLKFVPNGERGYDFKD